MSGRRRPRGREGSRLGTVIAVVFVLLATAVAVAWLVFIATRGIHL